MVARKDLDDKFKLYERSVQDPACDIRFMRRTYERLREKPALVFREDFCGTAILASEWLERVRKGRAYAIDIDRPTLAHARDRSLARLGAGAKRLALIHGDVLTARTPRCDIVAALNFSYFILRSRDELTRYFKRVLRALAADGVFFLDIFGGPEAQEIQIEKTRHDGFTFVWEQASFNPLTAEIRCHIHFELPGGRRMRKAFSYVWRLWTLPEVREVLAEAGYRTVDVYWEGTNRETLSGNNVFRLTRTGDDSPCWIAYIVAAK